MPAHACPSQVSYERTSHLLMTRWRDGDGQPQLHLFGQVKRIVKRWLDEKRLACKGGTYSQPVPRRLDRRHSATML
ncbi:MAG: hypothetical protein JNL68_08555 [Burkholderiales bacterium]|nr:hypothetical protein [Burkholderiales bacterium]